MADDFFGMDGELLNDDCGHRDGFTAGETERVRRNPDDAPVGAIHNLECISTGCGHVWKFLQHAVNEDGDWPHPTEF